MRKAWLWASAAVAAALSISTAAQEETGLRSTSAAIGATALSAPSSSLLCDAFDGPDGPVDGAVWDVTSGEWRKVSGRAYTASPVFRANTRRTEFRDVDVSFDLTHHGLTSGSGENWHGIHMFLRRYSEYTTYYVSIARRDGKAMIKKKVQGGPSPSNGGTYYDLASAPSPVRIGQRHRITGRAKNNADGSVTVSLFVDGSLVVEAVDRGTGGAPLTGAGGTGVRGDFAGFSVDDLNVTSADASGGPAAPAPGAPGTGAPIPAAGAVTEAKAPQRFLSPALADGINDAARFGTDAEDVTVFDASGRQVFHAAGGGAGVVWDCRDSSGRLVDSGVYIAKIRKKDSSVVAQSFAVVK
ncbi:MAG: hypothetical protein HY925_00090 [Elusimicrobia bacterium]|nr:hypothetical protein [Elusimicrobiota bacterium]